MVDWSLTLVTCTAAFFAFTLSSSAGLGGSLILVPTMTLLLGPKEGIAVAAVLLGLNNVLKVIAYRRHVPLVGSLAVMGMTVVGALLGASLLVQAPESLVGAAVIVAFVLALVFERRKKRRLQQAYAPVLAFAAGATSGFSGTSGPLKGTAIRSLGFDRMRFVGSASCVSLVNDVTKSVVFAEASLLDQYWALVALTMPLMLAGTLLGRGLNQRMGEAAFTGLFWAVMAGYSARLLLV